MRNKVSRATKTPAASFPRPEETTSGSRKPATHAALSTLKRNALLCSVALALLAAPGAPGLAPAMAQGAASQPLPLDIPAQDLGSALASFADRARLRLLFRSDVAAGVRSPALSGTYTREQALARLLAGSGLTYSFTSANTVTISGPSDVPPDVAEGSILLDPVTVRAGTLPGDAPYETAGSVTHISGETITRFPGTTAGDIFKATPGVISGSNRNGASIDPNVRGLQGMNRVATTVDGSEQSTSSYRGYQGVDSRSYIDPDLIGGVTVTKGPDGGSAGAIGGTIAVTTLSADDILRPGETYGGQVKTSIANNSIEPSIDLATPRDKQASVLDVTNGSASAAVALREDNFELVAAIVKRRNGNYFAGKHGTTTAINTSGIREPISDYGYGEEVFNTSQDSDSALLKGTFRPADDHEVELSYLHYDNTYGWVFPTAVASGPGRQYGFNRITIDQLSGRYAWNPEENDLIDFKLNGWVSNTDEDQSYTFISNTIPIEVRSKNLGMEAKNTSRFDVAWMPFALTLGTSTKFEDGEPRGKLSDRAPAYPVEGTRRIHTLYARGELEPVSWLKLDAGLEYLNYRTRFLGRTESTYAGPAYTGYHGDGFSPSVGVTVTPFEGWQLFARYTTGLRPPSLRETSYTRFDQRFNPDLKAERASNWEIGTNVLKNDVLFDGDKARLKLAYFDNTTEDYIGRAWDSSISRFNFFNYDRVEFKGFELSGGYETRHAFVDFAFNYYTDFESCTKDGSCIGYTMQADYLTNQIPPRYMVSVTAGAHLFDNRVTIGGRVTAAGKRLAPLVEDGNYFGFITRAWAPYTVVDLFGQWRINDTFTLDLSADNLFDRYYVDALNNTDMPAPGRTLRASLTGRLGGGGGSDDDIAIPRLGRATEGAPGSDWTGLYLGVHTGFGYGHEDGETTAADGTGGGIPGTESADLHLTGMTMGGQIGFNYQLPSSRFVIGLEGDFGTVRMQEGFDTLSTQGVNLVANEELQARTDIDYDWMATLRARFGYAFDRLFVYGTGGLAFLKESQTRVQYRSTYGSDAVPYGYSTDPFLTETADQVRIGYTVGAGAEYALTNRWTLKAEYGYTGFAEEDFLFPEGRAGVGASYRDYSTFPFPTVTGDSETVNGRKASNSLGLHTVKIGLNYRF